MLAMTQLRRSKNGTYFARKGIPAALRDDYQRLYSVAWEEKFSLPVDTNQHDAKARFGEWLAEVETRLRTLRSKARGEGQSLTKLSAVALAGEWYRWFIEVHHKDRRRASEWRELSDNFVWNYMRPEAPHEYEQDSRSDSLWEWAELPEVRQKLRPIVGEIARTATFLVGKGVALNAAALEMFLDAVQDNLLAAIATLERRASGDYSPDETLKTFPEFEPDSKNSKNGFWAVFERFVKDRKPARATVQRWRSTFSKLKSD